MALNPLALIAARVFNGFWPKQNPKALALTLDFTAAGSNGLDQLIDLELIEQESMLDFVQTIFMNNVNGGQILKITSSITNQVMQIAAGKQAYLPILSGDKSKFTVSTGGAVATGTVQLFFLNMPVPPIVW